METVIHNEGKPGKSVKNGNFWDTVYRQGAKNGTKYGFKTDACARRCDHPEAGDGGQRGL